MDTDKAYLLGLIIGGGIFGDNMDFAVDKVNPRIEIVMYALDDNDF